MLVSRPAIVDRTHDTPLQTLFHLPKVRKKNMHVERRLGQDIECIGNTAIGFAYVGLTIVLIAGLAPVRSLDFDDDAQANDVTVAADES